MNLKTWRRFVLFVSLAAAAGAACAQALPAAANTDPARAQVVLPEPANPALPSLILIGDSTVRNGRDDGQGKGAAGQWGWGNPIAAWFDPGKVNVVNRAVGGLSSRTYISSGHWERTLALVKAGDVVVMQFGHNDASPVNDNSRARGTIKGVGEESQEIDNLLNGKHETVYSYGWYLRKFVAEIRARGATPVICSPIPRKRWDEQGRARRDSDSYGGWAQQVAQQQKVGFIDLNEMAAARYDMIGREAVMQLFPLVTPDETVHTNWAGAVLNAELVANALRALEGNPLRSYVLAKPRPREDERPVVDAAKVAETSVLNPALPSFFIVGDSTVKSGGANGMFGWGERIAPYFDSGKINVQNHAIGGRSSRTFYTEGRWAKVLELMKAGDTVIIQFGHNDGGRIGDPAMKNRASGPGTGDETVEDSYPDGRKEQVHTFGWYMARYVKEAKAKGVRVILASPVPHKDKWQEGRDFASFAQWDEQVAQAEGAAFIDLTMLVADGWRMAGAAAVDTFFADARTHSNDAGAQFNAARVVEGLRGLRGDPLGAYLSAKGLALAATCVDWGRQGKQLYRDDFKSMTQWRAEYARKKGSSVGARDGKLVLDVGGGATAWFRPQLSGNYVVSYHRKVVLDGGANDRLSDLNQFWMASDPANKNLFTRRGEFSEYDGLRLYYAGIGGNTNTTTRFRKYDGGARTLIAERNDAAHLLKPNHEYAIEVAVFAGCTRLRVDGETVFAWRDPAPLQQGRFGLRTTQSRQEVSQFTIHALE